MQKTTLLLPLLFSFCLTCHAQTGLHCKGRSVTSLSGSVNTPAVFMIYANNISNSIVIRKDSLSGYLKYRGGFSVKYKGIDSKINIKKDSVYFEKYGFYDPFGFDFSGDMSDRRIGDLLPFEYFLK